MKAIILVSSLFYLLGLKISDTIDIFKNRRNTEPITIEQPITINKDGQNAAFSKETTTTLTEIDSTEVKGSNKSFAPNNED